MNHQLTHDFNLDGTPSDESFGILGDARVAGLVRVPLDVLDDQSPVGEDLLLTVNGQRSVV